jgi:hypothetical protein
MATQAVISLMKKGHTFIKIVCGCNGYNAEKLAKIIEDKRSYKIRPIYKMAIENNLGCKECLVVMDDNDIIFKGSDCIDPLYREMFDNPSFNPRQKNGAAEYIVVLKIDNPELIE